MGIRDSGAVEYSGAVQGTKARQSIAKCPTLLKRAPQRRDLIMFVWHWHEIVVVALIVTLGLCLLVDFLSCVSMILLMAMLGTHYQGYWCCLT